MLAQVRNFFFERQVLEVDCPALNQAAAIDAHIDVMSVTLPNEKRFLHTSPEYGMKRLLSRGSGDIYQMSHVFRKEESGPLHSPEFTMIEWYRENMTYAAFIDETLDLMRLFLGPLAREQISYREALLKYAGVDYLYADERTLAACAEKHGLNLHGPASQDDLLHLLMGFVVEPMLGKGHLTVLCDYPASQAALAKTTWKDDEPIAERFEVYYQGIELANGYHELTDAKLQRERFEAANAKRLALGKEIFSLDEHFLNALEAGLPDCCGAAVGFDRLLMLKTGARSIEEILPFSWTTS